MKSECRRDAHGLIKAGVSFERHAEEISRDYRQPVPCPDCQQLTADCAAKDAVIQSMASRMACMADQLRRVAERAEVRSQPFFPPEDMTEPN